MQEGECLHAADGKNGGDGEFGAEIHLQVPNHEGREDAECPVTDTGDCRVAVESLDSDVRVDAGARSAGVLGPEICRGATLEDEKEEEKGRIRFCDDDDSPDDNFVGPNDGDSEQEDANAEFERHASQDVGRFASPPPLRTRLA